MAMAPSYLSERCRLTSVEHPFIVRNADKVADTLGGSSEVAKVCSDALTSDSCFVHTITEGLAGQPEDSQERSLSISTPRRSHDRSDNFCKRSNR